MHMQVKTTISAALAAFVLILAGCGDKEEIAPAPAPVVVAPPVQTEVAPEPAKERPVYVYSGDRFRDPFAPAGATGGYSMEAVFDPGKATVKGIIYGPGQRTAVLSTGSGLTYFVKSGRIFDVMGKTVDGYTAKVMPDKVIVSGEADSVFELKIRNEEEKAL